jgi:single-stranded DNA-binding protein
VNIVSLIGIVEAEPGLRANRGGVPECRMRIAVPRRLRDGRPDAGVVYVDVTTFGDQAEECAEQLARQPHRAVGPA